MAQSTFYPDPDPETTTVDGLVMATQESGTWSALVTATSAGIVRDNLNPDNAHYGDTGAGPNPDFEKLSRSIFLFDTSSIPDNDIIESATLSLFGNAKADQLGYTPDIAIYIANTTSNTALSAGDYSLAGLAPNSTAVSNTILYANLSTTGYNDFTLNSSGLTNISKTGVSKFGAKDVNNDNANVSPAFTANSLSKFDVYFAEATGTANDPKLVVVHNPPSFEGKLITNAPGVFYRKPKILDY